MFTSNGRVPRQSRLWLESLEDRLVLAAAVPAALPASAILAHVGSVQPGKPGALMLPPGTIKLPGSTAAASGGQTATPHGTMATAAGKSPLSTQTTPQKNEETQVVDSLFQEMSRSDPQRPFGMLWAGDIEGLRPKNPFTFKPPR